MDQRRGDQNVRGNQNVDKGPRKEHAAQIRDMYIAVMGITGSGKSTFIQTSSGKNVKVGHNLESCTTDVEDVWFMYNDSLRVHLIDTPGFDDTNLSDVQVLQNIAHWLSFSFQNGIKLSGIIYLHRITDPRMTGSIRRNLLMFKKLCGENSFPSVVLATTFWGNIDEARGIAHEQELISKDAWWGQMYKRGSKVFRHTGSHAEENTGSRDSALALIGYILSLHRPVILEIQDEINNKGQSIEETAAARELNADITRERKKHQAELKAMKEQMQEAMAEHDEELRRTLKEEHDKLQALVDKGAAEQEKLKKTLEEVHARKEEEFRVFKAKVEADQEMERQKSKKDRRDLEEKFERQRQELQQQQKTELARMEATNRAEREKADAELRAKMDSQQKAHDKRVRQMKADSDEKRVQDEIFRREQKELQQEQRERLAHMEVANHEERERRDTEIQAQIDEQNRIHDEGVRRLREENEERERRHEEALASKQSSSWVGRRWNEVKSAWRYMFG